MQKVYQRGKKAAKTVICMADKETNFVFEL